MLDFQILKLVRPAAQTFLDSLPQLKHFNMKYEFAALKIGNYPVKIAHGSLLTFIRSNPLPSPRYGMLPEQGRRNRDTKGRRDTTQDHRNPGGCERHLRCRISYGRFPWTDQLDIQKLSAVQYMSGD